MQTVQRQSESEVNPVLPMQSIVKDPVGGYMTPISQLKRLLDFDVFHSAKPVPRWPCSLYHVVCVRSCDPKGRLFGEGRNGRGGFSSVIFQLCHPMLTFLHFFLFVMFTNHIDIIYLYSLSHSTSDDGHRWVLMPAGCRFSRSAFPASSCILLLRRERLWWVLLSHRESLIFLRKTFSSKHQEDR